MSYGDPRLSTQALNEALTKEGKPMSDLPSLPVSGYKPQPQGNVDLVNANKALEEQLLRMIDALAAKCDADPKSINGRWLSIGRTHIEQGFMAINRAIFQPSRAKLPGDAP